MNNDGCSDWITLNVGGKIFCTAKYEILAMVPVHVNSLLTNMILALHLPGTHWLRWNLRACWLKCLMMTVSLLVYLCYRFCRQNGDINAETFLIIAVSFQIVSIMSKRRQYRFLFLFVCVNHPAGSVHVSECNAYFEGSRILSYFTTQHNLSGFFDRYVFDNANKPLLDPSCPPPLPPVSNRLATHVADYHLVLVAGVVLSIF